MSETVTVEVEARSYELDPYGHVNNAVYVNWFEHGRSAWLRERGLSWASIPEMYGVRVVIVRCEIDYRAEIRLDDRLRVSTRIARFGRSSFDFEQRIVFPDDRLAAEAKNVMVCTAEGGAVPFPPGLRERLGGAGRS